MSGCNITGLTFDQASRLAIEEIKIKKKYFKALKGSIGGGAIITIFLGNNAAQSAYNLNEFDFVTMAKAIKGIDRIQARVISGIAFDQGLRHTGREAEFWECVHDKLTR